MKQNKFLIFISKYFVFIFFILIYSFFSTAFFFVCLPNISEFIHSLILKVLVTSLTIITFPLPWIVVRHIIVSDPGKITAENYQLYQKIYPYDHFIYSPNRICATDNFPIVARSHYCSNVHYRVAAYDHYCPWLLMPIGRYNRRYFLLFIIVTLITSITFVIPEYVYSYSQLKYILAFLPKVGSKTSIFISQLAGMLVKSPYVMLSAMMLSSMILYLIFLLIQQIIMISHNDLTIEIPKREMVNSQRKKQHLPTIKNLYDHGFVENWKEWLFPTYI